MPTQILTIYGGPDCRRCKVIVQRCQRKGVPYKYVDVEEDPAAADRLKALGYATAPVMEYGEDHWSGVRLDKIDALIPPRRKAAAKSAAKAS